MIGVRDHVVRLLDEDAHRRIEAALVLYADDHGTPPVDEWREDAEAAGYLDAPLAALHLARDLAELPYNDERWEILSNLTPIDGERDFPSPDGWRLVQTAGQGEDVDDFLDALIEAETSALIDAGRPA